ncbi:heme NO-binding domain-containing protein [Jannaschia formosa]|uniref:heme NO-binding domain-containing protein n=1 Tax=Jannaschia formosa TaxID=2259592 RepID=UPI00143084F8|nr:heme NO-binding domain-containing protein [Jannaschia formosa]
MICKSLEAFLTSTYGPEIWARVRRTAGLQEAHFETMRIYDDIVFARTLEAASQVLDRSCAGVMEDVGTWICTHPPLEPVRRLFRFCGTTFRTFLFSLNEIDARARMALPDLVVPSYSLRELGANRYEVRSHWSIPGAGGVLSGILHVLASDYGALIVIETGPAERAGDGWRETISVQLFEEHFHEPAAFALGGA